jgi:hypothetical protein
MDKSGAFFVGHEVSGPEIAGSVPLTFAARSVCERMHHLQILKHLSAYFS